MGEKRSNHTVYNVNYHFVWCPKYRHTILEPIEDSLDECFQKVCDEYGYDLQSLTYLLTTYTCSCPHIRSTRRVRLCERSRASRHGRCGNSTNRSWRATCGVVGSGKSRTTLGRQVQCRARRLNSILSERNTFSGAYGLHPQGQAPRHSACFFCRRDDESPETGDEPCDEGAHEIVVSSPPTVPDEKPVLDATEAGLTELKGTGAALSEAASAHTEEMDEAEEYVWLADGRDYGELSDALESTDTYVEFEETVYFVETAQEGAC
jgi:hypothetical protein